MAPGCGAGCAGKTDFGRALLWGWNGWSCCFCCTSSWWCCCGGGRGSGGVDPHPFGHGRAADAVTVRVDAAALYDIFNPTDLGNEWAVDEVGRVAGALVGLSLPFDPGNLAPTLAALDRAVFNSPMALTQTPDLVAADVTQGNSRFAMLGDANSSLDYHLWALALSMGSRYKPRPMHTPGGYDASSCCCLRQVGETWLLRRGLLQQLR